MSVSKVATGLLAAASVISFVSTTASAQPAADSVIDEGDGAAEDAVIVVTGSRISADGFNAPTPVTVLGAETIDRVAPTTVADILTQVPSFSGTGINGTSVETAAIYANLRGLGAERTLVLVNGRRHVSTFSDGTVDLGVIPTAMIERTEIVTGGASASWGSDAVSGVVNVILRDRFQGLEGEAQAGISDYGDAESYKLSLIGGTDFADGAGNVILAVEYSDDRGVRSLNDPFNSRPFGQRNVVGNSAFGTNGLPGTIYSDNVRASNYTSGGLITSGPLRGTQFVGQGATEQFGFGQVFGDYMIGGTSNFGVRVNHEDAKQPLERLNVYGRASFDISDSAELFVEANFARAISQGLKGYTVQRGATTAPATCDRTTLQSRFGAIYVPVTNPFLSEAVRDQLINAGVSCFSLGKSFEGEGLGQYGSDDGVPELYRGVIGFEADLSSNWTMSASVQHGQSDYRYRRERATVTSRLQNAIDAVRVGNEIVCRINADVPTANDDAACVPLNIFGDDSSSPAAAAYVTATSMLDIRTKQTVAAVDFGGSLLTLAAGDVNAAFGAEYREESVVGVADPVSAAGGFQTGNRSSLQGSYNVKEAYGELAIPLLRDERFFQDLSVNLASRYTDYSGSGSVVTWKVGARWDVSDAISLRATRSRDIRAGNIGELFTPTAQGATNVFDPRTNAMVAVSTITSGDPTIRPEEADTVTVGVVFSPGWLPGFRASVDYYDISIDGIIATLRPQQVVDRCLISNVPEYCDRITLVDDKVSVVRTSFDNLNLLETRGVDIELRYTTPIGALFGGSGGEISASVLANYVDRLKLTLADSAVPISPLGQYTNPNWTVFGTLGYSDDNFRLSVEERYFGGGTIDNTKVEGVAALNGININNVSPTWYTNLYTSYALNGFGESGLEVFARVDNLFNQDPPFPGPVVPPVNSISNQSRSFSVVGRYFRAGARFRF